MSTQRMININLKDILKILYNFLNLNNFTKFFVRKLFIDKELNIFWKKNIAKWNMRMININLKVIFKNLSKFFERKVKEF